MLTKARQSPWKSILVFTFLSICENLHLQGDTRHTSQPFKISMVTVTFKPVNLYRPRVSLTQDRLALTSSYMNILSVLVQRTSAQHEEITTHQLKNNLKSYLIQSSYCQASDLVLGENERREVTGKRDSIGRTALHYAAERDNSEIVNILLEKDLAAAAYYHDNAGYSPLHITAATACWAAFSALLEKCPDAMEQHDLNGRNVFHISVMNYKWYKDWPKQHQDMVNETDKDGNTPLHLAAKLLSTRLVFQLLEYEGIDLNVKNKEGLTAFDVAELQDKGHSARRETVMIILRMNGVGSGKPRKISPSEDIQPREVESSVRIELTTSFSTASALVATVAFAAVFTMPGGFKSDGTPVLLKHPAFAAFLIFNTLAMCFATIAGICFSVETYVRIFGRVWNVDLWGFFLSALACKTMLISFMTAAYVVVAPGCRWLAIIVCLICSSSILFHYLLFACQLFNYRPPVYNVVISPLVNFFGKIVTKKLSS